MANLGFVGLGVMGGRIALRLHEAGHAVSGYNRTRGKAQWLEEKGLRLRTSPKEVAANSDVVFSMVTDTRALAAVADGADGILAGLRQDQVYIDMSTCSPTYSRTLAERVAERKAHMLDAPVSGSVSTLEAGKLSIMVGGDEAIVQRVRPILEDIGPKVTRVGDNGKAVLMKIATNLGLAVQMLAFSEAVLLAERGGIDRKTAVDVLLNSVIASPMVQYRGPFVLQLPSEAWFDVNMMQKDLLLALELGRSLNVPLPTTAVTNELLTAARGLGHAKEDFAVLFKALAALAGEEAP